MEQLDQLIKNYILNKKAVEKLRGRGLGVPDAHLFYLFLTDKLQGDALVRVLEFIKEDEDAQAFIIQARKLLEESSGLEMPIPRGMVSGAKALMSKTNQSECPHCGKSITPFKTPLKKQELRNALWMVLGVSAFLLSFVFRAYFLQCLVVALLFGVKWIVDQKATKTQILIYKALQSDSDKPSDTSRLHKHAGHL